MPRGKRIGEFHSKDKRKLPVFIQSDLDDYGLSCPEFRTYARIARRAGSDSRATESVPNMAEAFGVEASTVRRALKVLCLCGLISKKERPGWTPEYALEDQDNWRDRNDLKAIRESVLHPIKSPYYLTPMPSEQGSAETIAHEPQDTLITTPTSPYSPAIDEGTPVKVLPEGTPILTHARELKPLRETAPAKYSVEEIRTLPDDWLESVRKSLREVYPDVDFGEAHEQWCKGRFRDGGIGKYRLHTATLAQYSADIDIFFGNWSRNHANGNGNRSNGNGHQEQPRMKTLREQMQERGEIV